VILQNSYIAPVFGWFWAIGYSVCLKFPVYILSRQNLSSKFDNMDLSSSSIKESSSISSKKVSSSSVSSSSKISSSSSLSSASSALRGMSSEVDDLLAASASARETARGLSSGLTERLGALTSDLDIDDMLAGTNIGSSSLSSSSISSASSKKQVSKMSSISQSSLEVAEGSSLADASVKSSVKSHSSSVSSSSLLASQTKSVDGEIVSAETVAERSSKARESQKEKVVEDGQVLVDTGFKMEQSSAAKLRATKEMSQQELDGFFRGDAITGKPLEALNFDKDANTFEVKK